MHNRLIIGSLFCLCCADLHASGMQYDVGTGVEHSPNIWITNYTMELQVPNQFINQAVQNSPYPDHSYVFIWPGLGTDTQRYQNSYPTQKDIVGYGVLQTVLTYYGDGSPPYPNPNHEKTNGWWISGQAVDYLRAAYVGTSEHPKRWDGGFVVLVDKGEKFTLAMTLKPGRWTQKISGTTSWSFNMSEDPSTLGQSPALMKAARAANSPQQKQSTAQLFIENVLGPPINAATFSNIKIYTNIANPAFCVNQQFDSPNDYIHATCTGAQYYPSTQFGQSYCQIDQCIVYADPILILPDLKPNVSYSMSYDAGSGLKQCINSIQSNQNDNSLLLLFHGSNQLFCDAAYPLGPVPKQIKSIKLSSPSSTLEYNNIQFNATTGIYTMQLVTSN